MDCLNIKTRKLNENEGSENYKHIKWILKDTRRNLK